MLCQSCDSNLLPVLYNCVGTEEYVCKCLQCDFPMATTHANSLPKVEAYKAEILYFCKDRNRLNKLYNSHDTGNPLEVYSRVLEVVYFSKG